MNEIRGPGRPPVHDPDMPTKLQKFRATEDEWAAFKAALPSDTREAFLILKCLLDRWNENPGTECDGDDEPEEDNEDA